MCKALVLLFVAACTSSPANPDGGSDASTNDAGDAGVDLAPIKSAAVKRYAELVHENYLAAIVEMKKVQTAVDAFVAAPSQTTLDAARAAWVSARPIYVQTEAFRFYDGPIDAPPENPEVRINAWPLDENYIDYTMGMPMGGIINDTAGFPTIDKAVIIAANEAGGEKNLSMGWHAIEFLLWGQDQSTTGPGNRPFTDYTTAPNFARRQAYLKDVAALLVEDMQGVAAKWGTGPYAVKFVAETDASLKAAFKGIASLAGDELAHQRIFNAWDTKDQEEEHSCFSDTTSQDHLNDAIGIENVWLGRFGSKTGPGLESTVRAVDPALADEITKAIADGIAAVKAIPAPFDQAILAPANDPTSMKIATAVKAWEDASALLTKGVAKVYGMTVK